MPKAAIIPVSINYFNTSLRHYTILHKLNLVRFNNLAFKPPRSNFTSLDKNLFYQAHRGTVTPRPILNIQLEGSAMS